VESGLDDHDCAERGLAMKNWRIGIWLGVGLIVGSCGCLWGQEAAPQQTSQATEAQAFKDDPQARALYDKMIEAFRQPQSLSYKSEYRWEARGQEIGRCFYTVWLKKPNYFRVEATHIDGRLGGTIVGDGRVLWLFWAGDRPHFSIEDEETYNKTKSNVYMSKPAPLARHSIGHEVGLLGVSMAMPILDPSTFHGYTDSLQPYLDGVMGMGEEKVGDEECDVIEASIMKHQRSWYLWLSKKDHLPRKLKQIVRVSYDLIMYESWSNITVDAEMPDEKFVWSPPADWRPWKMPSPEDILLKPGVAAPDFELLASDGSTIKLSDFKDKIVWFYIWRAG
jgi:outer membrane lipoprotein-sorting protein